MSRRSPFAHVLALAGLLGLTACGGGVENNLSALDNELMANGVDPALTSALEDQILVDPNLVQQSQPNSARPAEAPVQAQYPGGPDPEQIIREARAGGSGGRVQPATRSEGRVSGASRCGGDFAYGAEWARRLPAQFPLYPGAAVTEAAGQDRGACRMRVVTFDTGDPYSRVLEYYRSHAARAGFSAEHQRRGDAHVLGGVRGDAAYYLIVTPAERGASVALIVNRGA
ncbi:MAG: hypothetical protein AB7O91_11125 [Sphingomonas sp.]